MTTAHPKTPARSGRLEAAPTAQPSPFGTVGWRSALPRARDRPGRIRRFAAARDRIGWADDGPLIPAAGSGSRRLRQLALVASPGIWVLTVLVLDLTVGGRVQVTPLLAAAPAIACAGTGRRQCAAFGCGCALFALTPIPDEPYGIGQRVGTASAIVAVALAGYLIAHRRIGLQRSLDEVRRVADVAQRVLLRPVPARIGPVDAAVGYLAAAPGARIGGDFYEVIETPYGLRAILGDMRGSGLDAVGGAAALLGAFREAGAVEPDLGVVAARLDAALTRYAVADRLPGANGSADGGPDLRAEDFATAVLVQVSVDTPALVSGHANIGVGVGVGVGVGAGAGASAGFGAGTDSDSSTGSGFGFGFGFGPDFDLGTGLGTGLGLAGLGPGPDPGPGPDSGPALGSDSGTAELIVCGHPAPYLLQSCGTVRLLTPEDPTPPLGMRLLAAGPQPLTSFTVALRPGESLVCYTDGITESRDGSGAFFPLADVLAAVLADTDADKQPKGDRHSRAYPFGRTFQGRHARRRRRAHPASAGRLSTLRASAQVHRPGLISPAPTSAIEDIMSMP